ncbi:MAG: hypothetical protein HRT89_18920, partial [Lentisphaeria bacterium]|nr:hypothetical protein [Lentisphaeria bacterium]
LGGCWKSRVEALGDGDDKDKSLCLNPVQGPSGQTIPKCLDMISHEDVIRHVHEFLFDYDYYEELNAT